MLFDCPCKTGRLQVDETTVQVMAPFKKLLWSVPRETVMKITQQKGQFMVDLTIHTTQNSFSVQMLSKPNAEKFLTLIPEIEAGAQPLRGKGWYHDPTRLTYVASYTKEKEAQKELEAAAQHGWMPQGTSATAGHGNVGRTMTKFVLTGGIGLMTGASRSKDKITITFVRTPEWVAQHGK
jgi:hypothetical protein